MTCKVLEGNALAVFNEHAHTVVEESESSYKECMEKLAKYIFPKNALLHQKALLHCSKDIMKKPEVKVRMWVSSRLSEINITLKEFTSKFSTVKMLDDAKFIEIILSLVFQTHGEQRWLIKILFQPTIHSQK